MSDWRSMSPEEGQRALEAHREKTLRENNVDQRDTLNGMMRCVGGDCSFADKTMTFRFPIQAWQVNRVGDLHGGMICTAFDVVIAALARFFAGENFAPTVSLEVKYVRPAKVGDELVVTAKATSTGRRVSQLTGEARSAATGKLIATAAAIHLNVDTDKEHREAAPAGAEGRK